VDFRLRLSDQEDETQSLKNQGTPLKNGDILLLCSDGLTDLVKDDEILAVILENSLEDASQTLIDLANQRGGHDNITTVFVRVPEGVFVEKKPQPKPKALPVRSIAIGCLGLLVFAALAVAGFFGLRWLNQREGTPTVEVTSSQVTSTTPEEKATKAPPSGAVSTSAPTVTSAVKTIPPPSGSSQEGNIPPPPDKDNMTAVPTNTNTATSSPTATRTATPTVTNAP
jgi:sulfur transfer complex TusBCD TusB component (DsrH family)